MGVGCVWGGGGDSDTLDWVSPMNWRDGETSLLWQVLPVKGCFLREVGTEETQSLKNSPLAEMPTWLWRAELKDLRKFWGLQEPSLRSLIQEGTTLPSSVAGSLECWMRPCAWFELITGKIPPPFHQLELRGPEKRRLTFLFAVDLIPVRRQTWNPTARAQVAGSPAEGAKKQELFLQPKSPRNYGHKNKTRQNKHRELFSPGL